MRYLITLILLVTALGDYGICTDINQATDYVSSEAVIQHLNELFMNEAKPKDVDIPFPISIMDPFELSPMELTLPGEMFSVNISISNGNISGMSAFRLLDLKLSDTEPKIGFNILFPSLKFHADHYELDGNIYYAIPLKGSGVAHLEIYNLQFWGTLYMKTSDINHSILFDKLEDGDFSIEQIVSRTEFDHNIDNIITAMIEDLLAHYLNRFSKYLTATYSDTLIHYINEIVLMYDK